MSTTTMTEPRYFVDQRGGCIAVRDRSLTDPEYQGLHPDTRGVVFFRMGKMKETCCAACGHCKNNGFSISKGDVSDAIVECDRLNAINDHTLEWADWLLKMSDNGGD